MTLYHTRVGLPVFAALLAAALLLIAGLVMARYEDQLYSAQQVEDVTEQARILAASVSAAITFDDRAAAQEYVEALAVNPELLAAAVYNDEGNRLAQFIRPGASLPALSMNENRFASDHFDVTAQVTQNGKRLGLVSLRASAEPAQRRFARYAGLVLLVTMGALVIAVLSLSQFALTRRADELSHVNARLQAEMMERQRTEEALRQSHKMEAIGQLSGGIAHDFNNLIMIVKGNLTLLRKMLKQVGPINGKAEKYIGDADDALSRAAGLTQRILAFSRRQPLTAQSVNLSALITDIEGLIRHSTGDGIQINVRLNAQWRTLCDANQMENAILNLAINARDAMPDGGALTIETADVSVTRAPPGVIEFVPGEYVALTVRDTGTGMSEDVLARALDPFFTTKPQGKGTGLGLSMTFGYVRQSGGYLAIDSVLGRGTAITLYMPRISEGTP